MTVDQASWSTAGIDGRLLRYFVVLAEELHFTRAAQHLYVSQPALSNQIKRLEGHLGVPVFVRTTRGVSLSPAGEAFLPHARSALSALQTGVAQAVAAAGTLAPLRVDVIDAALSTPRLILSRLRAAHPEIPLRITTLGSAGQRQRILDGDLDVGFCGQDAASGQNIEHDVIRNEPIDVVMPAEHMLAHADEIPLAALANDVFYMPHDGVAPEWNEFIRRACHAAGFEPRRHPTATDGADTGLDVVREGSCITLGLRSTPHSDGTVARPLCQPALRYPWAMIWRQDHHNAAVDHIRHAAAETARSCLWLGNNP